jgi:uncharacterized protein YjbI with pentapeptide repeats
LVTDETAVRRFAKVCWREGIVSVPPQEVYATMPDMTREQLILRVKKGDKADRADLRGLDLSKAALAGASLARADLEGANLEGANLQRAVLKSAILRAADLTGADIGGAVLENADLEGAKLDRANLAGANLTRVNLEGASLTGANLAGACLSYGQLATANLTGADLAGAMFIHAGLEETSLHAAKAQGANFSGAVLQDGKLEQGDFSGALFNDAILAGIRGSGAKLAGASLQRADLSGAGLAKADLSESDLRGANLAGATLSGACFTGAKIHRLRGTGKPVGAGVILAEWVDASRDGDGSERVAKAQVADQLGGLPPPGREARTGAHRYFGKGDVLKNATLEFERGASVEIDSLFQNCTITLGEGTELVLGKDAVLADCKVTGAGRIVIHGKFFEGESPGIVGPRELMVSSAGALIASVQQGESATRFGFEKGCRLRVRIARTRANGQVEKGGLAA